MTLQTAIEKALAGGWQNSDYEWATSHIQDSIVIDQARRLALLDPGFWPALAKTEGWDEVKEARVAIGLMARILEGETVEQYFAGL